MVGMDSIASTAGGLCLGIIGTTVAVKVYSQLDEEDQSRFLKIITGVGLTLGSASAVYYNAPSILGGLIPCNIIYGTYLMSNPQIETDDCTGLMFIVGSICTAAYLAMRPAGQN